MSNVDLALFHTSYPCWLFLEYDFVSPSLVCAIAVAMVVYVCGDKKQKSLPPPPVTDLWDVRARVDVIRVTLFSANGNTLVTYVWCVRNQN